MGKTSWADSLLYKNPARWEAGLSVGALQGSRALRVSPGSPAACLAGCHSPPRPREGWSLGVAVPAGLRVLSPFSFRLHPVKPMNTTAPKVANSTSGTTTIVSENLINEAGMKVCLFGEQAG